MLTVRVGDKLVPQVPHVTVSFFHSDSSLTRTHNTVLKWIDGVQASCKITERKAASSHI